MSLSSETLFIPVVVVAVFVILGLAFWARYKTVSPDEAMLVTGSFLGSRNTLVDESGRGLDATCG